MGTVSETESASVSLRCFIHNSVVNGGVAHDVIGREAEGCNRHDCSFTHDQAGVRVNDHLCPLSCTKRLSVRTSAPHDPDDNDEKWISICRASCVPGVGPRKRCIGDEAFEILRGLTQRVTTAPSDSHSVINTGGT
jgi:hypothetical protein